MVFKKTRTIIAEVFSEFFAKRVLKLSAALAYYTIFSLPSLLLIVTWLTTFFFGPDKVQATVNKQLSGYFGTDAATQVQQAIKTATLTGSSSLALILGIILLVLGSAGVFIEIQDSINFIWHIKAKPKKGKGLLKMIIDRLLSFSMVITVGFLMLVSLILNSILDIIIMRLSSVFPETVLIYIANLVITFAVTAFLFAAIFKVLPDARIKWKDIRAGAIVTAIFFMGGKFLISYYLAHNRFTSLYGSAGSILIILLWIYFSAIILYFGAVFTRVYALHNDSHIYPNKYAVLIRQEEVQSNRPLAQTTLENTSKNVP
jgi:membrane protein